MLKIHERGGQRTATEFGNREVTDTLGESSFRTVEGMEGDSDDMMKWRQGVQSRASKWWPAGRVQAAACFRECSLKTQRLPSLRYCPWILSPRAEMSNCKRTHGKSKIFTIWFLTEKVC